MISSRSDSRGIRNIVIWALLLLNCKSVLAWQQPAKVESVPQSLVESHQIDTNFYKKHLSSNGLPILASEKVSDFALLEANWILNKMLKGRADIRRAIVARKIRLAIMAPSEMTTDVPEHSTLRPAAYWDKRARGLGATRARPAVSCGEENLLEFKGDPYKSENILIHEFAHVIHQHGLNALDPKFDSKLQTLYQSALSKGLWKGKYAGSNHSEYFAELVQSWFGTNRENDHDHNHVNTRAELKEYDPAGAALMHAIFGDNNWDYVKPSLRTSETEHLTGYVAQNSPTFRWPEEVSRAYRDHQQGARLEKLSHLPANGFDKSITRNPGTKIQFEIRNQSGVEVKIQWLNFDGVAKNYGVIAPGRTFRQTTYQGHCWLVLNSEGKIIGRYRVGAKNCSTTVN